MTATAVPRFDLLEAKTSIPALRPGVVMREALVRQVEGSAGARVVSVVAPAGYGKTTLLAQWSEDDPRPFAWVTVDARDDDPVLLLRYILAALEREGIVEPSSASPRRRAAGALWSALVPEVCTALSRSEVPFVIVLDDVHELTSAETHDVLGVIVRAIPAGSQIVLAGRSELTSGIARLRAAGAVVEVGPADLALSPSEAAALLEAAGLEIDDAAIRLIGRTEGWAAGLYLAALAWRADGSVPASDPSDVDRFVDDYLRSEHLATIPPAELRFLVGSSVLDRMSAELCDAVLERRDSARMLETIERANLFLVPLDRERRWYRYHEIFRAVLQKELERSDPGVSPALLHRAAAWCEENGLPEDAMAYAIQSDDTERMARLMVALGFPLYRSGRVATIDGWLPHFDDFERLRRFPVVAVSGALVHALRGRQFHAERWLDTFDRSSDSGPLPDGSSGVAAWHATVEAMMARHGVERMHEDASRALDGLGANSPFRPPALLALANAQLLQGDVTGAEARFDESLRAAEAAGATFVACSSLAQRALFAVDRDDFDAARSLLDRARDTVEFELDQVRGYTEAGLMLAARALLAARTGDAASARAALNQCQRLRPELTQALPFFAVRTLVVMARTYLVLGDANGARAVLLDAAEMLRHRPDLGSLVDDVAAVRAAVDAMEHPTSGWESSLTAAELRLLPLLTTHLTFREIGERLFVSRNTVKTQAISIYRKLGASSRGEAVQRATELGLVDDAFLPSAKITP